MSRESHLIVCRWHMDHCIQATMKCQPAVILYNCTDGEQCAWVVENPKSRLCLLKYNIFMRRFTGTPKGEVTVMTYIPGQETSHQDLKDQGHSFHTFPFLAAPGGIWPQQTLRQMQTDKSRFKILPYIKCTCIHACMHPHVNFYSVFF